MSDYPEDMIDMEEDDDLDRPTDEWICDNDEKAEWCLKRIQTAEAEIDKWSKYYQEQLVRITTPLQRTVDRMTVYLRKYLSMVDQAGAAHKTKTMTSYHLPSGRLELKTGGYEYQRDDAAMVEWLHNSGMGEYVKVVTKESADWAGLKKLTVTLPSGEVALKDTGEVVDGVKATVKPDSFAIK